MQMVSDWGAGQACAGVTGARAGAEERETFYIETLTRIAKGTYSAEKLKDAVAGEAQCHICGVWIHEGDVVMATKDGKLTTDLGDPYCDTCLPDEI